MTMSRTQPQIPNMYKLENCDPVLRETTINIDQTQNDSDIGIIYLK